jgi:hypothetical protein
VLELRICIDPGERLFMGRLLCSRPFFTLRSRAAQQKANPDLEHRPSRQDFEGAASSCIERLNMMLLSSGEAMMREHW